LIFVELVVQLHFKSIIVDWHWTIQQKLRVSTCSLDDQKLKQLVSIQWRIETVNSTWDEANKLAQCTMPLCGTS